MADTTRDPHEAIREAENALRNLIAEILESTLGARWLEESGIVTERLELLRKRKEEEEKRRPLQRPDERLLYYADLSDLRKVIEKHWDQFQPILRDKREFEVFFDKLEDFRNPDAHQRGLWPYDGSGSSE